MPEDAPPLPPVRSARPALTAELMAETDLDEDRITTLVHRFYDEVRADAVLGPIFAEHIANWGLHQATLPVGWAHFERWPARFRETARETCPPAGAAGVVECAGRIARSLSFTIEDAARDRNGAAPRL